MRQILTKLGTVPLAVFPEGLYIDIPLLKVISNHSCSCNRLGLFPSNISSPLWDRFWPNLVRYTGCVLWRRMRILSKACKTGFGSPTAMYSVGAEGCFAAAGTWPLTCILLRGFRVELYVRPSVGHYALQMGRFTVLFTLLGVADLYTTLQIHFIVVFLSCFWEPLSLKQWILTYVWRIFTPSIIHTCPM